MHGKRIADTYSRFCDLLALSESSIGEPIEPEDFTLFGSGAMFLHGLEIHPSDLDFYCSSECHETLSGLVQDMDIKSHPYEDFYLSILSYDLRVTIFTEEFISNLLCGDTEASVEKSVGDGYRAYLRPIHLLHGDNEEVLKLKMKLYASSESCNCSYFHEYLKRKELLEQRLLLPLEDQGHGDQDESHTYR
jgi:hypothetical protein